MIKKAIMALFSSEDPPNLEAARAEYDAAKSLANDKAEAWKNLSREALESLAAPRR